MRLFDLHCDTLYECYTKKYPLSKNNGHVDLVRMAAYCPCVQVFAAWLPEEVRGDAAWEQCCAILQLAWREEEHAEGKIHFLRKGESLSSILKQWQTVGLLAVEGGGALGGRLENIDALAMRGVKYLTLTWNGSNELGNGCFSPDKSGLTPLGRAAVARLGDVGIAVDVSHLNEAGFWDVAGICSGPFLATHSNAAAVCPHPRNLTDRQLTEIFSRGGLVGLNLCADFLGAQTMEQWERHLEHMLSLGGAEAVCLGCDMDGTSLPPSFRGIAVMERFGEYLYRKNYDSDLLSRLFFSNCYNFFIQL